MGEIESMWVCHPRSSWILSVFININVTMDAAMKQRFRNKQMLLFLE